MKSKLDSLSLGEIVQVREKLIKAEAAGEEVFRFESGGPSFDVAPIIVEELRNAAQKGRTRYVPNAGIPELRLAIREKLNKENNWIVDIKDIFVTNGAMNALFCVFQAMLNEGDEVIIPDPMWTEVAENITFAGGIPIRLPLTMEDGFQYDIYKLEEVVTKKTKAIFINSPHNPTGSMLTRKNIESIVDVASANGLTVITDEAYEHIVFNGVEKPNVFEICNQRGVDVIGIFSFSKSYAMPGLRLGYAVIPNMDLHENMHKILRCCVNGINSVTQWAGITALREAKEYNKHMVDTYQERADVMYNALDVIPGMNVIMPKGAFYVWCEPTQALLDKHNVDDAADMAGWLCEQGIGAISGSAFGPNSYAGIRFSFACPSSQVNKGCHQLIRILK